MDNYIKRMYEENRVIKYEDAVFEDDDNIGYFGIPEIYYAVEESTTKRSYRVGDIVFVPKFKYEDGKLGKNHLFVIIKKNNYAIPLDYFCLLISSNLKKLKYSQNFLLKKDFENNLDKDSIIKTDYIYVIDGDMISFRIGSVPRENIEFYQQYCNQYNEDSIKINKYIEKEKSIIDKEFELLENISKLRNDKKLSQRQLASIIGMKQPMLAKIENGKNSPQLNTLLSILDSLGYTIEYKEKDQ